MTNDQDPRYDAHRDLDRDRDGHDDAGSLVLNEEHLRVRTESIATGRVTFRKRIVTEERTLTVTVRREELEIIEDDLSGDVEGAHHGAAGDPVLTGDRLGDRSRAGADDDALRRTPDGDIEIVLRAEEPVVTLQTVPVERIVVRRGVVTDTQTFTGEVSREEAVVERDDLSTERRD